MNYFSIKKKLKLLLILLCSFVVTIISAQQNKKGLREQKKAFDIDSCINQFDLSKAESTKTGYLYWFVDKGFIDGRTLKMSVVKPHQATHAPHAHAEDEFFFVLDGTAAFHLNGETKTGGAYTSFYCPPNSIHGISNAGNTELKYLVIKKYAQTEKQNDTLLGIDEAISPKDPYNMIVAKDGSGDFLSIQDAVNAAKAFPYQRVLITIKNGVYNEKVHIYSWNTHISLIGESKEHTIITFDDYFDKINLGRNSTFHTSTVLVEGNDFIAKNLTIENTSGPVGQAVALSVNANRSYFENCAFLGFQDTLYTAGEGFEQYFKNCYIEGSTDFIFGEATALFESCDIHSKSNSYITAASTPKNQEFGYVFKNCTLTAGENVTDVYLGRPWRLYAQTVFMDCDMGSHINPEGWYNWSKKEAETTTFYAEYNCSGEGYKPKSRVAWSHQLKKTEPEKYTIETIFKSKNDTEKWYQK
mgnify:CR=1 FL=1|tara:strand:+ start:59663 stop:61075 length:1413 start_codon:yes stop_codon:yes gene_type:complete